MKLKYLGTALGTAALIGTALTGTIATAGTASAASLPRDCSKAIVNVKAKETVNVRTSPKTSATAVGIWGKGKKGTVCNDGKAYKGGSYKACGKKSNLWYYGGDKKTGWVPKTCINW
ncbi:hypothetical protein JK361_13755 [Streptomyces sp. 5-8]|uniref:SH3b domain-containing protein n=1 Tax=Streptomyces musisoli TaxID=2802280 RepID=A0ABS1NZU1_9ACTN|nr:MULTISPECIES: hypothetical protein [Streptomyces]MBL1105638.1 hypothetical protein [Streptomyces musisoli]MBY8843450.1 hypothetical protein [Streptomyces sp. SP2-10]